MNVNIKKISKHIFHTSFKYSPIDPSTMVNFFDKIIRGNIFSNTIIHGKIFYDKKEYYEAYFSNNELICHVDT